MWGGRTISGVFFDLYGTLLVYGDMAAAWADWLVALRASLEAMGGSVSEEALTSQCEGLFEGPAPPDQRDGLTVYERHIRALCAGLGLSPSHADLRRAAMSSARAWQAHISLDPETIPTLQALRSRKYLALISNYDHPPHVHAVLAESGLGRFFDAVVISGEVGVKKPDPRIFAPALQKTGLAPAQVVYVGDSPEGVQGAIAAGIHPILIRRDEINSPTAVPDKAQTPEVMTIRRLAKLVQVLRGRYSWNT